jgi:hypothetical protein
VGAQVCQANGTSNCTEFLISDFTTAMIGASGSSTANLAPCTYPSANFVPTDCQCHFNCTNGYTQCGTKYCMDPAKQSCQSGVPVNAPGRRSLSCPTGFSSCSVPGGGWECLNTDNDIESCGGCFNVGGVDCTSLPGVSSVSCVSGECESTSCVKGYSLIGNSCIKQ